jgi:tetratricopeptide (TPR) repeat protein
VARVFVSHASEDLALAREVYRWLIEAGHEVFLAQDLANGIAVGEEWEQRLHDELRLTDAVVCVVTSASLASRWCTAEVAIARSRGNRLLPIQAEPDVADPLLKSVQHTDLTRDPAAARLFLIEALRRLDTVWPKDRQLADPAAVGSVGAKSFTSGAALVKQFASCDEPVPCGRDSEAARLLKWLDPTADGGPTTIAVTGLPGVGKSTLAYYAGSKAKDWFRGGAVYINMNGYTPDPQACTNAEQVYGSLMLALGVDGGHGLSSLDAGHAGAIYHRKLAEWSEQGRPVLLMLDNVSDLKQVDGLLSEHRAHRVMITSRDADFLIKRRGLQKLQLDILDADDAVTVLKDVVHEQRPDDQRLTREPDKVKKLAELCGGLPQALELVGGLLAEHPSTTWMDELIRTLEASPLTVLGPVERAFRVSWQHLKDRDDQAARLLLLLSVNPGPDISTTVAAALGGTAEKTVHGPLQVLHRAHLINYDYDADRWRMHDLVRHCVDKFTATGLSADHQEAAFGRLLSHYQEHATIAARQAGWFLLRHSRPSPGPGPTPTWAGRMEALRNFETERLNLLGCLRHAARRVHDVPESDLGARLVALTDAMAGYLRNNGPWNIAEQAHRTAADIARHLGNRRAQAIALNDLGITLRLLGKHDEADQALQQAQGIFRGLSDTRTSLLGQANALNEMGIVANDRRHHDHATGVLTEAWELYSHPYVRDLIGMANSAKNLGVALNRLGRSDKAAEWLDRSLANYSEIKDVLGVVEVRNHLGLLLESNDPERALTEFHEAIKLMEENKIRSLPEEARAREGIGLCKVAIGEVADAMTSFKIAKDIYSEIGAHQARDRVAEKLDEFWDHPDA